LGSERVSKDGAIPDWTPLKESDAKLVVDGKGYAKVQDPFASEKPLLSITAQNMDKYADKLNETQKALLKRYPETFRMDVYPTHRTAGYSQSVIENTAKNAVSAKTGATGIGLTGAYGGIPFAIPKTGSEVMWNWIVHQGTFFIQNWATSYVV